MTAILERFGFKKKPTAKQMREMLPALHSFVDMAIKGGPKGSVCFENVGAKTFVTSTIPGMSAGQMAMFAYTNATGKYRFSASVVTVAGQQASYAMPGRIETVQKFNGARARATVRMDTSVGAQWRYAAAGKLESVWQKGNVSDISRTGCSLTSDRELKVGTALDVKIPLPANRDSIAVKADARRVDRIAQTKKFTIGLRFLSISPEADRAIVEFINRRQTDLRSRGLG